MRNDPRPYPLVKEWREQRIAAGLPPDPAPWIASSYEEAVELGSELFDAGREEGACPTCRAANLFSTIYYTKAGEDHAALACLDCTRRERRRKKDEAEQGTREALKASGKVKYIFRQGWVETDPPEWLEYAKAEAAKARVKWEAEEAAAAAAADASHD